MPSSRCQAKDSNPKTQPAYLVGRFPAKDHEIVQAENPKREIPSGRSKQKPRTQNAHRYFQTHVVVTLVYNTSMSQCNRRFSRREHVSTRRQFCKRQSKYFPTKEVSHLRKAITFSTAALLVFSRTPVLITITVILNSNEYFRPCLYKFLLLQSGLDFCRQNKYGHRNHRQFSFKIMFSSTSSICKNQAAPRMQTAASQQMYRCMSADRAT